MAIKTKLKYCCILQLYVKFDLRAQETRVSRIWAKLAKDEFLEEGANVGGVDLGGEAAGGAFANKKGLSGGFSDTAAMGAIDKTGVQRDDVHEHAESEAFLGEAPKNLQFRGRNGWIKEEFDRIVAGLAMDIDGAGKIRGDGIVKPVIISEPSVRRSNGNEVASVRMGDAPCPTLVEQIFDAGLLFEQGANLGLE